MDLKFQSINLDSIVEIDNESLGESSIDIRKSNAKVLIIKNCPSLSSVVNQSAFLQNVQNSKIFIIIAQLSGNCDVNELKKMSDKIAKSIILQIDNYSCSRLFHVCTDRVLKEIGTDKLCNITLSNDFDFGFVCRLLRSEPETFGNFSFELMKMKIDTTAYFNGKRLIELAIENENLLLLKFLKLFQPESKPFNENQIRAMKFAVESGNVKLLKVLLEIPVDAENFEAYLSLAKRKTLNLVVDNDLSLLMLAARSGKTDVIRFLLRCSLNINFLNKGMQTACDFAWKNAHYDAVVELVRADSPFPYDFDWDQLPDDSELKRITEERDTLHEQIRSNEIEEVKAFVKQNPRIRCAYDYRSQCALVTALESKNYEIYSFLRSKGFIAGIDYDYADLLTDLTDSEKDDIKLSNRKYFHENENSHIVDLFSRSRLGFGSDQFYFEKIQKYFEDLDAIPEVQPILRVVAQASKLDIVFDFQKESIDDMDPTQKSKYIVVKGRTIYENGNILIGAKNSDAEVLATMAHEFTHYAMHLLYEYQGHPYHAADKLRRQEFSEIIDFCETRKSINPVIENVFEYQPHEHAVELIVRVPHLLALHFKESSAVAQLRQDFSPLFEFFLQNVLSECDREIPLLKVKQGIQDLNRFLGLRSELQALQLFCVSGHVKFNEIVDNSKNILIHSSTPNLFLCNLLNQFKKSGIRNVDSLHIFIRLEQLLDPTNGNMIREAFDSVIKPKLFVLASGETKFAEVKYFYNYPVMGSKVVTIAESLLAENEDEENFEKVFPIQHKIEYKWSDLDKISQMKVLAEEIQFQGKRILLSDILAFDSKILRELPLREILNLSEMKMKTFNERVPANIEVYIERTFSSIKTADHLTVEEVTKLLIEEKCLILTDDSGMGKTVSALHFARVLKQKFPYSWVVYIDLKMHTENYYRDDEIPSKLDFSKILKLESCVGMKLFEHFYENKKVIFILDGFDEICPVYKNCVLEGAETVRRSNNLLFVISRTHLGKVLKDSLCSRVIKLNQFTIEDQLEFLAKFWSCSNGRPLAEYETKAQHFMEIFRENMTQEDFFGVPLQVRMIAEIYENSDPSPTEIQTLKLFLVYQNFIRKKIETWVKKGPLATEDIVNLLTSNYLNIMQTHQKLAIENYFNKNLTESLGLPEIEDPLNDDLLARIGLLQIEEPGKYSFTYQSFGEYFIADFVLSNVAKKTLLTKSDELHQMFLEVLKDENFAKVRSFMNDKLETEEKLKVDILSEKLETNLKLESNQTCLHSLVKENLSALLTFVLETVKTSQSVKFCLIRKKNEYGDGTLHAACAGSSLGLFKELWRCIESFSNENERRELLFSSGIQNNNVLCRAICEDNNEVLEEMLKVACNLLDATSFKKLVLQQDNLESNALNTAAKGRPDAFNILWAAIESKLQATDQKDVLFSQEKNRRTVLLNAIRHTCKFTIASIFRIMENLSYAEKWKFLLTEDIYRDTALHNAVYWGDAELFTNVWNFVKQMLDNRDLKLLWQKKYDSNIFMRCIERELFDEALVRSVMSAAKEILDPAELRVALVEKRWRNTSFISVATDKGLVDRIFQPKDLEWVANEYEAYQQSLRSQSDENLENNPLVQDLRNKLMVDIGPEELKATLYAEVGVGDTALHFALEFGSRLLADRIFQLADRTLSKIERQELIQATSLSGANILTRYHIYGDGGSLNSVCNFLVRQSDLVNEVSFHARSLWM